MTKKANSTSVEQKVVPFALELPSVLDVAPLVYVAVSRNYTARVFMEMLWQDKANPDGTGKLMPHYGIVVTNTKTGARREIDTPNYQSRSHRGYGFYVYTSLALVRLVLEEIAFALAPKRTTTVDTSDED